MSVRSVSEVIPSSSNLRSSSKARERRWEGSAGSLIVEVTRTRWRTAFQRFGRTVPVVGSD